MYPDKHYLKIPSNRYMFTESNIVTAAEHYEGENIVLCLYGCIKIDRKNMCSTIVLSVTLFEIF